MSELNSDVYRVIAKITKPTMKIDSAIDGEHWIGYRTNGGSICLLAALGSESVGFVSNRSEPVFVSRTKHQACAKALDSGRELFSSLSLYFLVNVLS